MAEEVTVVGLGNCRRYAIVETRRERNIVETVQRVSSSEATLFSIMARS